MSASSRRRWASSLLQKTKKKRKNIFQIESFICVVFNHFRNVICVEACRFEEEDNYDNMVVFTVAQKGHTCKLKMLLQTKNFTCKSKIGHAN